MNPLRTRFGLLAAAIAALAVPSSAAAESLVPPDNSAVNQYTESFPTAGGDKDSEKAKKGVTPAQTLGAKNAKRLEAQGEDGRVVAEVAAETAPVAADPATSAPSPDSEADEDEPADPSKDKPRKADGDPDPAEGSGTAGRGDGGDGGASAASGSSGAGEVLGQATGLSDGQMGLLLPLVLLAGLAWALAFLWRRRGQSTA